MYNLYKGWYHFFTVKWYQFRPALKPANDINNGCKKDPIFQEAGLFLYEASQPTSQELLKRHAPRTEKQIAVINAKPIQSVFIFVIDKYSGL